MEQRFSCVLLAGPTPKVLAVSVGFFILIKRRCDNPHYKAEHEEAHCNCLIVNGELFGTLVAAFPIAPKYDEASKQRDTCH